MKPAGEHLEVVWRVRVGKARSKAHAVVLHRRGAPATLCGTVRADVGRWEPDLGELRCRRCYRMLRPYV